MSQRLTREALISRLAHLTVVCLTLCKMIKHTLTVRDDEIKRRHMSVAKAQSFPKVLLRTLVVVTPYVVHCARFSALFCRIGIYTRSADVGLKRAANLKFET